MRREETKQTPTPETVTVEETAAPSTPKATAPLATIIVQETDMFPSKREPKVLFIWKHFMFSMQK